MAKCAYVKLELMMHFVLASAVAVRYILHVKNVSLFDLWLLLPCSSSSLYEFGPCVLRAVSSQVRLLFAEDTAPKLIQSLFLSPHLIHACAIALGGIQAGGYYPTVYHLPTEVPLLCWLSGTGSWRWFTITFVCFWYCAFSVAAVEECQAGIRLRKQGIAEWRAAYRIKSEPLPLTWLLTKSQRPIKCDIYWQGDMASRAVALGVFVYALQFWSDPWDRLLFGPLLWVMRGGLSLLQFLMGYFLAPFRPGFRLIARGLYPAWYIIKQGPRLCNFVVSLVCWAFKLGAYVHQAFAGAMSFCSKCFSIICSFAKAVANLCQLLWRFGVIILVLSTLSGACARCVWHKFHPARPVCSWH